MIRKLYEIYDSATGMHMGPLVYIADGEAVRDFTNQSVAAESRISLNPEHYSLYRMGEFDDAKGIVIDTGRTFICSADECISRSQAVKGDKLKAVDEEIVGNA